MENTKLITEAELDSIMLCSAINLPDSPSDRGMRPAQIKKALAEPVRLLAKLLSTRLEFLFDGTLPVLKEMTEEQVDIMFT